MSKMQQMLVITFGALYTQENAWRKDIAMRLLPKNVYFEELFEITCETSARAVRSKTCL